MTALSLDARIASVRSMLTDIERFLQDLRNAPRLAAGTQVMGWDNGLYVHEDGRACHATNVINATRYEAAQPIPRAWNGSQDEAQAIDWERALAREITRQEDLHTWLCGQYRDLLQEQVDAQVTIEPAGSPADYNEYDPDSIVRADEAARRVERRGTVNGMPVVLTDNGWRRA